MTENEAIDVLWEFKTDKPYLEMVYGNCHDKALDMAINALEEIQQYLAIGTVDECWEAWEKQRAKKPVEDRHHGIRYTEIYRCSVCGNSFSGRGFAKYCYHCGQAIDWSDE